MNFLKITIVKVTGIVMILAGVFGAFASYMSWSNSGSKDIWSFLQSAYIFPVFVLAGIVFFRKASQGKMPFEK